MAQYAIGSPFLRQLHHTTRQVAVVLLELGLEPREESECVRCRTRESSQDLVVIEAPELLSRCLQHFLSKRDLAVSGYHDLSTPAHAKNGGRTNSFLHL